MGDRSNYLVRGNEYQLRIEFYVCLGSFPIKHSTDNLGRLKVVWKVGLASL